MATLRDVLTADERVREGDPALWEKLDRDRVRCYACGHCCPIPEGQPGVCKVRFNHGGTLYVPYGYVAGVQCDPIEKKPFFHAHPGALAYSFGMLGCDSALLLLPELGYFAGAARSERRLAAARGRSGSAGQGRACPGRKGRGQHL